MKKYCWISLFIAGITFNLNAQPLRFNVGPMLAFPIGTIGNYLKPGWGANFHGEYFITSNFSLGGTISLLKLNGKNSKTISGNTTHNNELSDATDFNTAAALRFYPSKKIITGIDIGGYINRNSSSERTDETSTGSPVTYGMDGSNESDVYLSPLVGFNVNRFQFLVSYSWLRNGYGFTLFTSSKQNIQLIGVGINYML